MVPLLKVSLRMDNVYEKIEGFKYRKESIACDGVGCLCSDLGKRFGSNCATHASHN
jgi:hypothetical protein